MCGIFTLISNVGIFDRKFINEKFLKGQNRGPEFSKLIEVLNDNINNNNLDIYFGFHRLAINGLNEEGNQPIIIDDIMPISLINN